MARDLDPASSPAAFLGAELRRARVAVGMSQETVQPLAGVRPDGDHQGRDR
jgi:hypothetical protein